MPPWHLPVRRRGWPRPRLPHCLPRISHYGLRRAGSLRSSHSRGADGRQGPGSGACLGRPYYLRRPTVARRRGYPHCGLPVPAILGCWPPSRRGGSPTPMAARRPDHPGMRSPDRVPRKCRQSSAPRISRSRPRAGRYGLRPCGRTVYGGGSRCAAPARTPVHPCHSRE